MLNTRVLSLGVFTNEDCVDIVVGSLIALDGDARADVREQLESSAKGQVERNMALSNWMKS